jgi:hypothetical protein
VKGERRKTPRWRRSAESACRAVGFAKAEGASHSAFLTRAGADAWDRLSPQALRIDATPGAQDVFNTLSLKNWWIVPRPNYQNGLPSRAPFAVSPNRRVAVSVAFYAPGGLYLTLFFDA